MKSQGLIALAFDIFISPFAVVMVNISKIFFAHFGVFLFFLKSIFGILFYKLDELRLFCTTVTPDFGVHVNIASVGFIILFQIKLIEEDWFSLVKNIPAGT